MRKQGTGTIEKKRDRFLARLPDDARTSLGAFTTYVEAETELNAAVWMLHNGKSTVGKTLFEYGQRVIDRREKDGYRGTLQERQRWNTYVKPWEAGAWPPSVLQRMHVQALVRELRDRKLSTSTIRSVRALISAVMKSAIDENMAESNPCHDVTVKGHGRSKETKRPLSIVELAALFWAADVEARHLIAFAAGTGLRQGELRSLRVDDVHIGACSCAADVRSDSPHVVVRYSKPGKPTKSGEPRYVPLFGFAFAALASWKIPPNDRGLVFPTARGCVRPVGRVVRPDKWPVWLKTAGLDRGVRWHDLRHTCATLLLSGALGRAWSTEEVKDMLGHSTVRVTEQYVNVNGSLARAAAERHHSATSATTEPDSAQARAAAKLAESQSETPERCGSDSNRRVTDLQSVLNRKGIAWLGSHGGAAEALRRIVLEGGPFAWHRVMDVADALDANARPVARSA